MAVKIEVMVFRVVTEFHDVYLLSLVYLTNLSQLHSLLVLNDRMIMVWKGCGLKHS
jgi:hypothetical protein